MLSALASDRMDFDLSDDQLALRNAAVELLADQAGPTAVRAFSETTAPFDATLWASMLEQGWIGLAFSEAVGGVGLGLVELAVLLEAIGGSCAPVPLASTVLAARACERSNVTGALDGLLSGELIGCVAWSKRSDAIVANERNGAWFLSGRTDPVMYASIANLAIVPAVIGDTHGLFAVDLDEIGRPAREPAMDLTRPLAWLRLDETSAQFLGAAQAVDSLLDDGAVFAAAEMLGGAQAVLDMTVAYAKDRVQFGRPIGSFQAVKHRCADMLVDVEGMRSTALWAAWSLGAGGADTSIAASTAKCWASDASKRVMASGLQVHGGIGFTWEHDLHFFMKRAQLDQLLFGDAAYHRNRLAQLLRPRVEAGESVV